MTPNENDAAPTGLAGTTGSAPSHLWTHMANVHNVTLLESEERDIRRIVSEEHDNRIMKLEKQLRWCDRLITLNAKIEEDFVDGSPEKMVAEIARLTGENEFLHDLLGSFEWQRINAMSIAEVEKELLAEGYTRERLDEGLAKIRATIEAARAKCEQNTQAHGLRPDETKDSK